MVVCAWAGLMNTTENSPATLSKDTDLKVDATKASWGIGAMPFEANKTAEGYPLQLGLS